MNLHHKSDRARGAQTWADEFEGNKLICSDSPDLSGVNAAAAASAELGNKAFEFYRTEFEKGAGDRAEAAALAKTQAGIQNELSSDQLAYSREERARTRELFQPIEARVAADAMTFDTPERKEEAARAATADVQMQLAGQRGATMRAAERSGALPSSGKVMALQGMQDIAAAKVKAGAANNARQQIEALGRAQRMDAIGVGKGIVSNQATTASLGMNAGNSAVNNGQAPVNIAAAGAGLMGQGFQTNLAGQNQAMNGYGQIASIQQKADASNAALFGSLGNAAGMFLGKPPGL